MSHSGLGSLQFAIFSRGPSCLVSASKIETTSACIMSCFWPVVPLLRVPRTKRPAGRGPAAAAVLPPHFSQFAILDDDSYNTGAAPSWRGWWLDSARPPPPHARLAPAALPTGPPPARPPLIWLCNRQLTTHKTLTRGAPANPLRRPSPRRTHRTRRQRQRRRRRLRRQRRRRRRRGRGS